MTIRDWRKEVKSLTNKERIDFARAIEVLRTWEAFKREFSDTGIFTIKLMLDME